MSAPARMTLRPVVPDTIWCAEHPVRFGPLRISTRMTVVRLADGTLWVHSPVPMRPAIAGALHAMGEVAFCIAPNRMHHLHFTDFLDAFPNARGFVAPGLEAKRTDLVGATVLDGSDEMPWSDELDGVFVEGLPAIAETVFFHRASGTLIVADLLFCFGTDNDFPTRTAARLLGVHGRLNMSRTMRAMVKDRVAFAASVARIVSWDVRRVILAHDRIVEDGAARALEDAFAWLGGRIGEAGARQRANPRER